MGYTRGIWSYFSVTLLVLPLSATKAVRLLSLGSDRSDPFDQEPTELPRRAPDLETQPALQPMDRRPSAYGALRLGEFDCRSSLDRAGVHALLA
jgi:hypothetical protein